MKYFLLNYSIGCIVLWSMLYVSYLFWPSDSMWVGYLIAAVLQFLLSFTTYKG